MNALKEKLKNYLKVFNKKKIPKPDSKLRHIPWIAHTLTTRPLLLTIIVRLKIEFNKRKLNSKAGSLLNEMNVSCA
jgi:hypothetical protein